jgi:hypothetical protein
VSRASGISGVGLALLVISAPCRAQLAGVLDVGTGLGQPGFGAWQRETRIAPELRFVHRAGFLRLDAAAVERAGRFSLPRSNVMGTLNSPAFGPLRFSLSGHYDRDASSSMARVTESLEIGSALSARLGRGGIWGGVSAARHVGSLLDLGAWRVFGSTVVSLASQSQLVRLRGRSPRTQQLTYWDSTFNDTTGGWNRYLVTRTVVDSGSASQLQHWADLEARVDWSLGRLMLSAALSGRGAMDSTPAMLWGRANAVVWVSSRVSLVAGAGMLPAMRGAGIKPSRFATLGIRLSPSAFFHRPLPPGVRTLASAFAIRPAESGTYRISITVPNARTVELSGDFTGWAPVTLRETAPDVWEVALPLAPGTHRVNVRVDGDAWSAPPGIPTVLDEFNGRVGLIVVR